jgi:hypothetical protein
MNETGKGRRKKKATKEKFSAIETEKKSVYKERLNKKKVDYFIVPVP